MSLFYEKYASNPFVVNHFDLSFLHERCYTNKHSLRLNRPHTVHPAVALYHSHSGFQTPFLITHAKYIKSKLGLLHQIHLRLERSTMQLRTKGCTSSQMAAKSGDERAGQSSARKQVRRQNVII